MATTFDFTAANGTGISTLGLTLLTSEEKLEVQSNALARRSSTGTIHVYVEGSTGSHKRTALTFSTLTGTSVPRPFALGSWDGSVFRGYTLFPNNATDLRVTRHNPDGSSTNIITGITVASSNARFDIEAEDTGSATTVNVRDAAGTIIATTSDSHANRATNGYSGLGTFFGTAAQSSNNGDDLITNVQDGGGAITADQKLLLGIG